MLIYINVKKLNNFFDNQIDLENIPSLLYNTETHLHFEYPVIKIDQFNGQYLSNSVFKEVEINFEFFLTLAFSSLAFDFLSNFATIN